MNNLTPLREKDIDIVYCSEEKNISLFLSTFFEACGIISVTHEFKYLPKNLNLNERTIYLLDETTLNQISPSNSKCIYFVHSDQNDEYDGCCSYQFNKEGCKKILNYMCDKWEIGLDEREELNILIDLFIKNNFWYTYWLATEMHKEDETITKYIQDSCRSLKNDLNNYKEAYFLRQTKWYFEYMLLFCDYIETYTLPSSIKTRFEKSDEIMKKINDFYKFTVEEKIKFDFSLLIGQVKNSFEWNDAFTYFEEFNKKHSSSDKLFMATFLKQQIYDESNKKENYSKAIELDPSNYRALYFLSKEYRKEFKEILNLIEITNILNCIPVASYTSFDDFKYYYLASESLICNTYIPKVIESIAKPKYEHFYNEVMTGNPFEKIFTDMAFEHPRNLEHEEKIKMKLKKYIEKL